MAEQPEKYDYVTRRPCSCISAAVYDDPSDPKLTGQLVAEIIASGRTVERVPVSTLVGTWYCNDHRPEPSEREG